MPVDEVVMYWRGCFVLGALILGMGIGIGICFLLSFVKPIDKFLNRNNKVEHEKDYTFVGN